MANPNPYPVSSPATQFKPGQSGNPGGKPVHARNKLQNAFLLKLAADFEKNGEEAIVACREKDPAKYVQIVAALMPKQVEQTQPLDDFTDEQLLAAIAFLRSRITDGPGEGAGAPVSSQQAH